MAIPPVMNYVIPAIGAAVFKIDVGKHNPGVILTQYGFVVCDPEALETGCPCLEDGDPTERCLLKRGHVHLRLGAFPPNLIPNLYFGLKPASNWLVILPFHDLPEE